MSRTAVRRAIYGKLASDTTLNGYLGAPADGYSKAIYHTVAPDTARWPFVIISRQSGVPRQTFGDPAAFENEVWLVKAIDSSKLADSSGKSRESADTAESIADRIAALLNDANLSISGRTVMVLRRESDVEYSETLDGERFYHVGALYRLIHRPA